MPTVYFSAAVGPLPLEDGHVLTTSERHTLPDPDKLVGSDLAHYAEGRLKVAGDHEQPAEPAKKTSTTKGA